MTAIHLNIIALFLSFFFQLKHPENVLAIWSNFVFLLAPTIRTMHKTSFIHKSNSFKMFYFVTQHVYLL